MPSHRIVLFLIAHASLFSHRSIDATEGVSKIAALTLEPEDVLERVAGLAFKESVSMFCKLINLQGSCIHF